MAEYSPMMQHYLATKNEYKDCILFYRLGDFYEMFFEDAIIVSKELELTLTGKDCGQEERAPMCGVPFHAAETYINRLVSNGHKVAICEQMEDPKQAKGIVKREVIKVVTPGTNLNSQALDETKNNYLMSIVYLGDVLGVAIADYSTGDFFVTEIETGAGQWGTALSMACSYFDLDCQVYMVKCSYEQKPFRREVMRTYGASVTPSPSMKTNVGRKINEEFPGTTGSLGCAISEAVEAATSQEGYRYVLGSVLTQVLLHQSIIGLETKAALDKYGVKADMIIGCAGGGSNLGGLISPFAGQMLRGEADYKLIAVEPASCPSLTRGKYAYDFCDTGKVCPLAKMYTLGSGFIPSANHAGGLRYHGMSSVVSELYDQGLIEARSVEQTEVFKAAEQFARIEGILPAPESSHAIKVAIDEALKCKETGEEKNIVFGLTGTGYFDMFAYQRYNDHEMSDYIPTDEELQKSLSTLPVVE